jgi:serine/threonine-protein kinase
MSHKDWRRTEELFHKAVGLSAEERGLYLDQACSQDATLRAEVESLIAAFEDQVEFMERPAFSLGIKVLSEESKHESLTGRLIGPYKVLAQLGRGGMGEVYLAEDSRLDRKVALKFLSNRFTDDAWARRQLVKEAQAVARLDHPNICTVYGYEEHDGFSFIVMQYVEGETLASLICNKLIEPKQVHTIAIQIASALAESHSHAIVHRDVKPQNIMVSANGQVKVLDFGLAKLVRQRDGELGAGDSESHSSQSGLVLGTVAYMSPEQLRAERLDFRSDIFSFGIVLYEMISGRNPYSNRSNAEIISAILTSDPPPLTNSTTDIPPGLARVAQKCLKRDREQRYQSASELLLDFDNLQKEVAPGIKWRAYLTLLKVAALALLLLLVAAGVFLFMPKARVRTLAVLPIVNKGTDQTTYYLSEGLTEGLASKLSRVPELRVKAPTMDPVFVDQDVARMRIGRDLKDVDAILMGTLTPRGESLSLQITMSNAADGSPIWQGEYSLEPAELLGVQNNLAYQIASNLQPSLNEDEKKNLADIILAVRQTENPEAHRMYILGRHYWRKRNRDTIQEAITFFKKAIELDPYYAQAHAGLASCYVLLNSIAYGSMPTEEAMSKAKAAARDALEIDDTLCEAHTSLGVIRMKYDWKWIEAEREFTRAISLDPDYAPAHFWYSQLLSLMGRHAEAISESEKAKELEPFSPPSDLNLGRAFYLARQYDRAIGHFRKILDSDPDNGNALYMLGLLYQQKGFYKESVESFEKLYSLNPELAAAPLGYAYARAGKKTEALKMLDLLEEIRKKKYVPDQELAIIYMGIDDRDKAFLFFEQACRDRAAALPFIKIDPLFDSIRADSRYADLARCANISN